MDSPLVSQLFRQLFSHRTCSRLRSPLSLPFRIAGVQRTQQWRKFSSGGARLEDNAQRESHWQQRTDLFPLDKSKDFEKYPMVTADGLRSRKERPKRVKMLMRDFIEGSIPYTPTISILSPYKTAYTTQITATSANKPSFSPLATPSTSIAYATSPSSISY